MIRAVLTRLLDDKQTLGHLQIFDGLAKSFECSTLELPWLDNARQISCIPAGRYRVIKFKSPTKGHCFSILDVPGRTNVLIHIGNYAGSHNPKSGTPDTLGCILIGSGFSYVDADKILDVTGSTSTLAKLLEIMPDSFTLDIVDVIR